MVLPLKEVLVKKKKKALTLIKIVPQVSVSRCPKIQQKHIIS